MCLRWSRSVWFVLGLLSEKGSVSKCKFKCWRGIGSVSGNVNVNGLRRNGNVSVIVRGLKRSVSVVVVRELESWDEIGFGFVSWVGILLLVVLVVMLIVWLVFWLLVGRGWCWWICIWRIIIMWWSGCGCWLRYWLRCRSLSWCISGICSCMRSLMGGIFC